MKSSSSTTNTLTGCASRNGGWFDDNDRFVVGAMDIGPLFRLIRRFGYFLKPLIGVRHEGGDCRAVSLTTGRQMAFAMVLPLLCRQCSARI
jgi:hypothetical protein